LKIARFLACLWALGILMATLPGCGKKGDPFLPQKEVSAKVINLRGEWEKGNILLRGEISARNEVAGARVYYAQYPLENPPCEGCPIEYQGHQSFGAEVVTEEGFLCIVPIKVRGQVYFFRVNLMGPGGEMGPPSETVKVVVK
jgi:predicted small lipoprotein YifL